MNLQELNQQYNSLCAEYGQAHYRLYVLFPKKRQELETAIGILEEKIASLEAKAMQLKQNEEEKK
jgi:hypothetical protein